MYSGFNQIYMDNVIILYNRLVAQANASGRAEVRPTVFLRFAAEEVEMPARRSKASGSPWQRCAVQRDQKACPRGQRRIETVHIVEGICVPGPAVSKTGQRPGFIQDRRKSENLQHNLANLLHEATPSAWKGCAGKKDG